MGADASLALLFRHKTLNDFSVLLVAGGFLELGFQIQLQGVGLGIFLRGGCVVSLGQEVRHADTKVLVDFVTHFELVTARTGTLNVAVVVVQAECVELALETHQPGVVLIAVGLGVVHVLAVQRQRNRQVGDVDLTETFPQAELAGAVAVNGQGARRGFGAGGWAAAVFVVVEAVTLPPRVTFRLSVGAKRAPN